MFTWIVFMTLCTDTQCATEPMAQALDKAQCYELAEVYSRRVHELPEQVKYGVIQCRGPEDAQPEDPQPEDKPTTLDNSI